MPSIKEKKIFRILSVIETLSVCLDPVALSDTYFSF